MADRLAKRNSSIWVDYFNGESEAAIAAKHKITQQRVSQILEEIRTSIPSPDKDQMRNLFLEQLRWGTVELAKVFAAGPIPAYSNGRPVVMEDPETGEEKVAEDHSGRWAAWDRILRNQERAARMVGIDAKTEASLTVDTSDEVAALLARAKASRARE